MPSVFDNIRVVEVSGVTAQWCGKLMADMGADVIRVEPPGGAASRAVGPFYQDEANPDRSLNFWHNNTNKKSLTLDLTTTAGANLFRDLVKSADVVVEDQAPGTMPGLGLGYEQLKAINPGLIMCSLTPFGQDGPWRDYKTTDLVSLALGGPLWSCGYDDHNIPPTMPYRDSSYHIGSHYAFIGISAALILRQNTGEGQYIDCAVHQAAHCTTEGAMPTYYFRNEMVKRQTGRHASAVMTQPVIFPTIDGKAIFTRVPVEAGAFERFLDWLDLSGMVADLREEKYRDVAYRRTQIGHMVEILEAFCSIHTADDLFHGAQERGMVWAAVRSPDETLEDEPLRERGFFHKVEHPELGKSFEYTGAPYVFHETPWAIRRRAPLVGEDSEAVLEGLGLSKEQVAALREGGII